MERIINYINTNLDKKIDLALISKISGYSPNHFCKRFKEYTGVTLTEYLRKNRMQMAIVRMLNGTSITDTAIQVGYETISGFEKAFQKTYNCSPKEYIKRVKVNEQVYEEHKNRCILSNRCLKIREAVVTNDQYWNKFIGQHRYYYWRPKETGNPMITTAERLVSMIKNHDAIMNDSELIVGYNYSNDKNYNIETFDWNDFSNNLAAVYKFLNKGNLNKEQINEIIAREKIEFPVYYPIKPDLLDKQRTLVEEKAAIGRYETYNHSILDYNKVLKCGFSGILEEIREKRVNAVVKKQRDFYDAAEKVCEACCEIGKKYAREINTLIVECTDEDRLRELKQIYEVVSHVPEKPARNFYEAVQSLWFAHCINTWEDGINSNSIGRLDQILYPYYKNDINKGILTEEFAFELLCCLWLKLYREYDVQQVTIGGCDQEGNSAINELSYMILDVCEAVGVLKSISLRFSSKTPKDFMKRALEIVCHMQRGIPSFYNDDIIIPALEKKGISLKDARDYAIIGYSEIGIPGKANTHSVSAQCNLVKALEYALNEGKSMFGENPFCGVKTLPIKELDSFEKLMYAVERQMKNLISCACEQINVSIIQKDRLIPCIFKSILTEGCLEYGLDYTDGGAKYNYYHVMFIGVPNLVDSLMAINKLVYKDRTCSLEELINELKNNIPNELLHKKMLNAPKFGNGDIKTNSIANYIVNIACDHLETLEPTIGEGYLPQTFSSFWNIEFGKHVAATPDGRRCSEPLAYSISPTIGTDFNGVTGIFNSICSLPNKKIAGTTAACVELNAKLLNVNEIDYFLELLLKAAGNGLSDIQLVVMDESVLSKAMYNPEKYADMAIRAFGRSQRFAKYDDDVREYFIGRAMNRYI